MRTERGQSLVELAISLVVLLWLLSGAVELGIIFFQYIQLRDAAQEGALYGSLNPPKNASDTAKIDAIVARAKNSSSSPIDLADDPKVTVSVVVTGLYCEGGALTVTASYTHQVFMPFFPQMTGLTQVTLNGKVTDTILTPAPLPSGACPP